MKARFTFREQALLVVACAMIEPSAVAAACDLTPLASDGRLTEDLALDIRAGRLVSLAVERPVDGPDHLVLRVGDDDGPDTSVDVIDPSDRRILTPRVTFVGEALYLTWREITPPLGQVLPRSWFAIHGPWGGEISAPEPLDAGGAITDLVERGDGALALYMPEPGMGAIQTFALRPDGTRGPPTAVLEGGWDGGAWPRLIDAGGTRRYVIHESRDGTLVLARTNDAGDTWDVLAPVRPPWRHFRTTMAARGDDVVLAGVDSGEVWFMRSHDAGTTWRQLPSYRAEGFEQLSRPTLEFVDRGRLSLFVMSGTVRFDVYHALSRELGDSWSAASPVTCGHGGALAQGHPDIYWTASHGRDVVLGFVSASSAYGGFGWPMLWRQTTAATEPTPFGAHVVGNPSGAAMLLAELEMPEPARVASRVFDVRGRERMSWATSVEAGPSQVDHVIDPAEPLEPGVYFWELDAGPLGRRVLRIVRR